MTKRDRSKLSESLGRIYRGDDELRKISRPDPGASGGYKYGKPVFLILALIILAAAYFWLWPPRGQEEAEAAKWYAARLVNEEVYYGQIADVSADPIILKNVYYNYDQEKGVTEAQNLRLVKRGQEIHGPDGTMIISRARLFYLEPLKQDSKVLTAIMSYEH